MRELASVEEIGQALEWICGVLRERRVPFQVVGGLAAHVFGASRPVVDIDMYAPLSEHPELLPALAAATVWGPQHYRDESWDLVFMKLDHGRVRIEIGDSSANPRLFDQIAQRWTDQRIDFSRSVQHTAFGVCVPVIPKQELIAYKTALNRDVDLVDIAQIAAAERS